VHLAGVELKDVRPLAEVPTRKNQLDNLRPITWAIGNLYADAIAKFKGQDNLSL
jgi:hypothetical protein